MTTLIDAMELGSTLKTVAISFMIEYGAMSSMNTKAWVTTEDGDQARAFLRRAFVNGEVDRTATDFRRSGGYICAVITLDDGSEYTFRFPGDFGDLIMRAVNDAI